MPSLNKNTSYNVCDNGTTIDTDELIRLQETLVKLEADVVVAGKLLQKWKNGDVKKYIEFEHLNNELHPLSANPPIEPGPFLKERWNPFHGFFIYKKSFFNTSKNTSNNDPDLLLKYSLEKKLKVIIVDHVTATKIITFLSSKKNLKNWIGSSYLLRRFAIYLSIIKSNTYSYLFEHKKYVNYYEKIKRIKESGEIVLQLDFGGLGDCLSYSTLPRLLKEQFDVDFYINEKCKDVFRHQDIFNLCFGLNPFFKGFKESNDPFILKNFIHERPVSKLFSTQSQETAVEIIERQFNLIGKGLPEIYYAPNKIEGYKDILFCDKNWFSGKKWGLYNDQKLLEKEIAEWCAVPGHSVEFCDPNKQNIFEYIDKIYSSGKFLCYFSGGNALAATLNIPATVIVPENLDGNSLSLYLFTYTKIKYLRNKTLDAYY